MHFSRGLTASTVATGLATAASLKPRQSCGAEVDELVGFGAGTTGGGDGDGNGTAVSSCEDLAAAAEAGGVIQIEGTLDGCDIIDLPSDTSVLGVGADAGELPLEPPPPYQTPGAYPSQTLTYQQALPTAGSASGRRRTSSSGT